MPVCTQIIPRFQVVSKDNKRTKARCGERVVVGLPWARRDLAAVSNHEKTPSRAKMGGNLVRPYDLGLVN